MTNLFADNVISLADRAKNSIAGRLTSMGILREEGALYDIVKLKDTYTNPITGQVEETGRVDLINGDTGEFVSNMSAGYTVVQNAEIFEAMERQIATSGLDITGMEIKVDVGMAGGNVCVQYIFPAHSVDTSDGDSTSLMITAINSFNGSSAFCIYLGGFRGYCMNTQVFGTTIVSYRKQHCRGLSINKAADVIRNGIDVFNQEGEVWKRMAKTSVTDETAFRALADFGDVKVNSFDSYSDYQVWADTQRRTQKLENYMRIFKTYVREMGNTEFALYNTFTHINTHGSAKVGNRKQSVSGFETRAKDATKVSQKWLTSYAVAA